MVFSPRWFIKVVMVNTIQKKNSDTPLSMLNLNLVFAIIKKYSSAIKKQNNVGMVKNGFTAKALIKALVEINARIKKRRYFIIDYSFKYSKSKSL